MRKIFFLIICIGLMTCKKIDIVMNDPNNPNNGQTGQVQPIFQINGTLGNNPLKIIAGQNNIEMATDFSAAKLQLVNLTGIFKSKNCTANCKGSFRFNIRQNNQLIPNPGSNQNLKGTYVYYLGIRDSLKVSTKNTSTLSSSSTAKYSYVWTVNDRSISDNESVIFNFNPDNITKVCLNIKHPDGSKASQCQVMSFTNLDSATAFKVDLKNEKSNSNWVLTPLIFGAGPFKYQWDGQPVKDAGQLEYEDAKGFTGCLTVTDRYGNTANTCVDISSGGKIKSKANFDMYTDQASLLAWLQFSTVDLTYIDDNGLEWNTNASKQTLSSYFNIVEDVAFDKNDKGQNTRKLKIDFNSVLVNKNGQTMPVKANGVIAVAVPN